MVFRVPVANPKGVQGQVDYRLVRAATITAFRRGELSRSEVCDAHPELVRAANQVGVAVVGDCPVCGESNLVHVTYVFGPRLPSHGRCISLRGELARLAKRPGNHVAYYIEVCRGCNWNQLVRRSTLGQAENSVSE